MSQVLQSERVRVRLPAVAPARPSWWKAVVIAGVLLWLYMPTLAHLVSQWWNDPNYSHGFFVPLFSAFVIWQERNKLSGLNPRPSWAGLLFLGFGLCVLIVGQMGAELFLSRLSLLIVLAGLIVLFLGWNFLRALIFPWAFLLLMIPVPAIVFNQITFPLQLLASKVASTTLPWMGVPVLREGNVIVLPAMALEVAEACSGIRSLLTLTFFSLVYGYVFEKRGWARAVLFFSTIPITIAANAGRVALTGVVSQFNPDLAEGWFHEAQGMVIFVIALAILIGLHQLIIRTTNFIDRRHA